MDLFGLGWNTYFSETFASLNEQECVPARVAVQHKGHYLLFAEAGELRGEITGRMLYNSFGSADLPAVGDWVAVRVRPGEETASILAVLPRRTAFVRRAAGEREEQQVLAANADVAFLVNALDGRFKLRRIERYLVVAHESGARPVILLNKADLCEEADAIVSEVQALAPDVVVRLMSAKTGAGIDSIHSHLGNGITGVLIGPSGVGKSTIINSLLGVERMPTRDVRDYDERGRHTTTRRELVRLPGGGLLMDTPGMRELQLPDTVEDITESFQDIEELAARCRFRDCRHDTEPDCAVRQAIENGDMEEERLQSYRKLQREQEHQRRKVDRAAGQEHKEKVKKLTAKYRRWHHR